jgi:predicted integral membrane protein DUF2269
MDLGTAAGWVVLVHALSGVLLIASLIGRWIVLGFAERASTVSEMRTAVRVASPFERLVQNVSTAVLVFGIAAAIAVGRPFLGPLQGGHVDWLFVAFLLYISIIPLIPLVFLPKGRVFEAALAAAGAAGDEVTPDLRAAWRDPVTRAAHVYELSVITIILVLMLAKPF